MSIHPGDPTAAKPPATGSFSPLSPNVFPNQKSDGYLASAAGKQSAGLGAVIGEALISPNSGSARVTTEELEAATESVDSTQAANTRSRVSEESITRTLTSAPPVQQAVPSYRRDLLLLILSLVGTFAFAGATAVVGWRLMPATAAIAKPNDPPPLDLVAYARGQKLYASSCTACHGPNATGVPRLGKDLLRSPLVLGDSDRRLIEFIKTGRPATDPANTTGVPMPPRGGNAALSDKDLGEIVVYLRGLQHPLRVPAGEAPAEALADLVSPAPVAAAQPVPAQPVAAQPAAQPQPAAAAQPVAPASGAADPESIARGQKVYVSCMACHGKDATGVKGMGKDLVHSEFAKSKTDDQLLEFIKKGRGPTDPENTTKVGMPPKGGNPALGDKQLRDLIAYLRSLQAAANK